MATPTLLTIDEEVLKMAHEWPVCESDGGDVLTGDLLIHRLADEIDAQRQAASEPPDLTDADVAEMLFMARAAWEDATGCSYFVGRPALSPHAQLAGLTAEAEAVRSYLRNKGRRR